MRRDGYELFVLVVAAGGELLHLDCWWAFVILDELLFVDWVMGSSTFHGFVRTFKFKCYL